MSADGPTPNSSTTALCKNPTSNSCISLQTIVTLNQAALSGNLEMLSYFIEQCQLGVDTDDLLGCTSLMLAAGEGQVLAMKFLLQMGAKVNAKNIWGETALMIAAKNNQCAAMRLLLENGADVNCVDNIGESALAKATYLAQFQAMSALSGYGARPVFIQYESLIWHAIRQHLTETFNQQSYPQTPYPTRKKANAAKNF